MILSNKLQSEMLLLSLQLNFSFKIVIEGSCGISPPLSFGSNASTVFLLQYYIFMQISKEHGGIMRFIQVSCLGASSSSPSRFLRAKAAAEEAVLRELPEVESFSLVSCMSICLFQEHSV